MKAIAQIVMIDSKIKSSKHAIGTGVLRNVYNADKLINSLMKKHSLALNVISAEDEAKYVYYAAMPLGDRGEVCVAIDVGGASTELAYFGKGKRYQLTSIPIGLLKLLKECSNSLKMAEVTIAKALEIIPSVKTDKVIGVGLTYTYLARALFKDIYASDKSLHGKVITKSALSAMLETFDCGKEHEYIPYLVSDDYLPILMLSAMFLISMLDKFQCKELIVCSHGISSGYARSSIMKAHKKGRKI
jgi:exopolyphosphatase/guanosine-5'-triphosphate,3'-diphosphate pyrophosphatase